LCFQRLTTTVEGPENATVGLIDELIGEVGEGAFSYVAKLLFPLSSECAGEGPKDARVENDPLLGLLVDLQIIRDPTAKPTIFFIRAILEPKRGNVVAPLCVDLVAKS